MKTYTEYLIIGQGIAGSLLVFELDMLGKSFVIMDNGYKNSSSIVAAGTINPITGRNYVKTWRADELWPALTETYRNISAWTEREVIRNLPIIRSLHSIKEENAWLGRVNDPAYSAYLKEHSDPGNMLAQIEIALAYGEISGAKQLKIKDLLPLMKAKWRAEHRFIDGNFTYEGLEQTGSQWKYEDIIADKVIFCEGHKVTENPFFKHLSFDPVKGEALIVEIEEPFDKSLRDKTFITPLGDGKLHWCGAGYSWQDLTDEPTENARKEIEAQLDAILRVPYKVVDHIAGIRPATKYRRPFAGAHPTLPNLFIFNGLGTKGSSLGPFFARQLVQLMENQIPMDVEVALR